MAFLTMFLITVLCLSLPTEAVQSIDYPEEWKDCLREIRNEIPLDKEGGALTVTTCLNQYLFSNGFNTWHAVPTDDYKAFKDGFCHVEPPPEGEKLRMRKEYRMMSKGEKRRFHSALNKMWENGTYDFIVQYHADASSIPVAHGGPGFFPWHRIYLMRLEDELRKYEPDLTLPYWDCTLEAELFLEGLGPHWSKVWNKGYAGYGSDIVTKGPFKDWQIRRRFGDGNLPNRSRVDELFDFTEEQVRNAPYWSSPLGFLERIHNSIHMWVGGDMIYITLAPKDPVFFLLHSYIDYLWEKVREYYKEKYGIDPEENYPDISKLSSTAQSYHNRSGHLPGFEPLTLLDGYSNRWTRDVYQYEISPMDKDCSICSDNDIRKHCKDICGENLKCRRGKCVPKLLVPTFFDDFERQPPTTRSRRDTSSEDQCNNGVCDFAEPSIQNDFLHNGVDDTDHFRWVAVKVLNRRPLNQKYNTYAVHDDQIDTSIDLFDPQLFPPLAEELNTGDPGTYDHCVLQSVQSYVVIRSDSLSAVSTPQIEKCPFAGKYAFDTEYAYMAVVNPQLGPVNVSFIAYDQCGRLCTPYARQPNGEFKRSTGLFHLDASYNGYGGNPSELINKQLYTTDGLHDLNDDIVFLAFDCDASTEYYFNEFL